MDFILEEEMIDIITLCLQEPSSNLVPEKKERFKEIRIELFESGGLDSIENFFFEVVNDIVR